jgi:hypothetical protein
MLVVISTCTLTSVQVFTFYWPNFFSTEVFKCHSCLLRHMSCFWIMTLFFNVHYRNHNIMLVPSSFNFCLQNCSMMNEYNRMHSPNIKIINVLWCWFQVSSLFI